MKRALLWSALSLALAGCPVAVDPDLAIAYACDPASALGDSQCAGGWVCASDGLCRDPSVGAPTPCANTSDCRGGWRCGQAGVCYDRETAGAIPCRPELEAANDSDCADGWRCPSGGICQQEGVFAPYPCITSADCEGGGHCGLVGRCYLRETAGDIPCRRELDDDPVQRDCAPDWVCSANGRCVDARAYELRPNGPLSALAVADVHPAAAAVDHSAAECFRPSADTCSSVTAVTLARGRTVELHRVPISGAVPAPSTVTLAGDVSALATTTLPGAVQQAYSLVVVGDQVLHLSWPPSGEPLVTAVTTPFVPERLLAPSSTRWFLGVRGEELFFVTRDTAVVVGTLPLPPKVDGGVQGYGPISAFSIAQDVWLTAVGEDGVYAARGNLGAGTFLLGDGGTQALPEWTPVRVPGTTHQACSADDGGTGVITAIAPTSSGSTGSGNFRGVRVAYLPGEGDLAGRESSYLFSVRVDATPTPCGNTATGPVTSAPLCPLGSTFLGMSGIANVALCEVPLADGGTSAAEVSLSGAEPVLQRGDLGLAPVTAVDPGGTSAWTYGSSNGQAVLRAPGASAAIPMRLARAPGYLSADDAGTTLAHDRGFTYEQTDAGFVLSRIDSTERCASIRGDEQYRLGSNGLATTLQGPFGSAALADSERVTCSADLAPMGEVVTLGDGGTGLLIAARDRLWANVHPPEPGVAWPVRLVPAPFANITSLAPLQPSPETAAWVSAYVIANEQVFDVRGDSLNRWASAPLESPAGEPFRVWADPQVGRVTYRDGTTYSLPLFAQVSGPLPTPFARGVREACGAAYAIAGTGLFRLQEEGQWSGVAVPERDWTRLLGVGEQLFVFSEEGHAIWVTDTSCLRP